jgi:hypothetical protein
MSRNGSGDAQYRGRLVVLAGTLPMLGSADGNAWGAYGEWKASECGASCRIMAVDGNPDMGHSTRSGRSISS